MHRFWNKVNKTNGCWLWMASKRSNGYGCFRFQGKLYSAHRFAYQLAYGDITDNLLVCHKCDVRNCVNPDHLFLGTHTENLIDAIRKKRSFPPSIKARGESSGQSKLIEEQVLEIRQLHADDGLGWRTLSKKYGVSGNTINKILRRETWTHI